MFRRVISICLLAGCLSNCVGVFLAGAATGGLAVYDRRNLRTLSSDQHIRYRINKRINEDPQLKNAHVGATCFHSIVLLTGQAVTPQQRITAERIARSVPGLNELYNEVQITPPIPPATRTSDAWITVKVKTDLLGAKDLRSGDIKVVTENSTVYLMGIVTKHQADLAVHVTQKVTGVKRIVKVFRYAA